MATLDDEVINRILMWTVDRSACRCQPPPCTPEQHRTGRTFLDVARWSSDEDGDRPDQDWIRGRMALELLATPHGENLYLVEAAGELWSDGGVASDRTGELLPMLERAIHHGTLPFAARLAGLVVADRAAAEENSELDRLILAVVRNLRPWRRQSTVFDAGRELWRFAESWRLARVPGVVELARAAIVPSGGTYGACLAGLVRRELRTGDIDRARIARARDALFARDAAS